MKEARIRCFIAMPFGQEDCDALYRRKIYPVLKSLKIEPIRVDQIEHRDDLNVLIIKKIHESDIALVDLTYSRPSVYYEAGYAEREMGVIYIVRADHLSKGQSDDRLRVHFDLTMKKIIPWETCNDRYFIGRLKSRIKFIISPIRRENNKNRLFEESRKVFLAKSVRTRINDIVGAFKRGFERKKFWTATLWDIDKAWVIRYLPAEVLVSSKMVNKTCYFCVTIVTDALAKRTISNTVNGPLSFYLIPRSENIKEYKMCYYFCSLQRYQASTIPSILSDAVPTGNLGEYKFEDKLSMGWKKKTTKIIKVISPIESDISLREGISNCLNSLPLKRTNRYAYLKKSTVLSNEKEIVLSNKLLKRSR